MELNWKQAIGYISAGLLIIIDIVNNVPVNLCDGDLSSEFKDWMKPRVLKSGELSVNYKHLGVQDLINQT